MAQWAMSDASSNACLWAPTSVRLAPTTTNRDNLYGNTTADAFTTGQTVGMFAMDNTEAGGYSNVTTVAVSSAGSGFTVRPTVVFSTPQLDGGTTAAGNTTARVVAVAIGDAGTGYTNGNVVTVAGGTGTAANVTISNTSGAGVPNVIAVTSGQAGSYTALPTLANNSVSGGDGSGLKVNLTIGLNTVTVSANGSGYLTAPTVTIGGAGGTGAVATASINTSEGDKAPHAGWVLRTEGSGGRAGRIHYEVLVASGSIGTDNNADDTLLNP